MEDVREVSAELHRLAESGTDEPFDTAQVLERGRKGRRRRKLFGAGGAVVGVAAIAITASLLPNLRSTNEQVEVAGNSQFGPVPGVPRGEAAADQRVSMDEAQRRCALRYPNQKRKLQGRGTIRAGHLAIYDIKIGEQRAECIVPGGDKPSAELVAAAAKDPVPKSIPDKLRNCSVIAWIDLTGWQVVASDESKTLGQAIVVAISPSGHKVVSCQLMADRDDWSQFARTTTFATLTNLSGADPVLDPADKSARADMYTGGGGGGGCTNGICTTWSSTGWGRVESKAGQTVRLRIGKGPVYQVPVGEGGWFAYTWYTQSKYRLKEFPKVAAYDKNGKVVKVFE
ncbi:hypothetical protein ACWGID_01470 [Kribbella sp. NPDC054772]